MQIDVRRAANRLSGSLAVSCAIVLILCAIPTLAVAQDQQSIATLRQMGKAFASMAEKASPAVVGVTAERVSQTPDYPQPGERFYSDPQSPFDDDMFRFFFGPRGPRQYRQPERRQVAQGSGFIITSDGYVLTNNHLVGEATRISVQLADGRKLDGKLIGADPQTDVAVVKIEGNGFPHIELADSDALEVGEWVIAIGNPFGLSHTVTAGIVSAKGRSRIGVADYEDFIQTDAAINFGNSGGPLLNLDGKAVGMNTAIIGSRGNVGIGLAIPINMAKAVYRQLVDTGKVVRGFLGVTIQDFDPEMAESFGMKDTKGVLIGDVSEGSAAEKAGIKPGDIVIEFEGEPVGTANDFRNRVAMRKPGSKVAVVVLRNGQKKTLSPVLDTLPEEGAAPTARSEITQRLGISVQDLTSELARRLGYEGLSGVVVTEVEPGSQAGEQGIREGSLIMEVDRQKIESVQDFNAAVKRAGDRGKVLLWVKDEQYTRFIVLLLSDR